jgi:hypothetical protein
MTRTFGVAAAFAIATASQAPAAVICVTPPAVTSCPNHTIQAAVNLAAAGDIVQIAPGTYFEGVTVPAGKDNLQIRGLNKLTTIIDHDVPNAGSIGIRVDGSHGVKISNLTVRNGTNWGIQMAGNNESVSGVRVLGVRIAGSGGIYVGGDGAQVLSNEVRASAEDGIIVIGSTALIRGNTVAQIARTGIMLVGAAGQVVGNKVTSAGFLSPYRGLNVLGTKNTITANILENVGASKSDAVGVFVIDPEPTIVSNTLAWAGVVSASCNQCNGGKIALNSLTGSSHQGYFIASEPAPTPAAPLTVQGNKASQTAHTAFLIQTPSGLGDGAGINVLQNTASDSGKEYECFFAMGSGHTFTSNVAQRCATAGFYSSGDHILFKMNQAQNVGSSGFLVDGYNGPTNGSHFGVTLTSNKATSASGQGFALYGTNGGPAPVDTTGTGNSGLLNRQDVCNEGEPTTLGTFATSSTTCDIRN